MEAVKVKNLSFRYPETGVDVLRDVSFTVQRGEFVTLCGLSGSGKSTLLRQLKPALAPHGVRQGEIYINGNELSTLSPREQTQLIGFVQQSPDNQIVTDKVWHELSFGLESLGHSENVIRRRVAETATYFGLQQVFDSEVSTLSGGQKQLLNLASVMAMQPELLLLDEPTSQLDPIAAAEFLACLQRINREMGTTVIITEHRLEDILPLSDRVLVLENGELICDDLPKNTGKCLKKAKCDCFLSMPAPMRIWDAVSIGETDCPVTVTEGRAWLNDYASAHKMHELDKEVIPACGETAIKLKNTYFRYEKSSPDVIQNLSLSIQRSEFLCLLGGNGTGKSTLLNLINGTLKPYRGKIISNKELCLLLPQNPQTMLNGKTVRESLCSVFDGKQLEETEKEQRLKNAIGICGIGDLLNRHPFDLSGGEMQKVALAKLLLLKPAVLLLDEPTKGLDSAFKAVFARIIRKLTSDGCAVVMVSHDVEFCAKYAHRCLMLFDGDIVAEGTPREFFSGNGFYATAASRISRGVIDGAVTAEDVIYSCTGENREEDVDFFDDPPELPDDPSVKTERQKLPKYKMILGLGGALLLVFGILENLDYMPFIPAHILPFWLNFCFIAIPVILITAAFGRRSAKSIDAFFEKKKLAKRTIAAAIMILLLIPATIYIGNVYLYDQKYLFISLLVLFECMLPFFLVFEGRKPQARELVLIAVLCALTVAGRTAFAALPQIKPVIALVIISGAALGGETGFVVGATAMLVSNVYFGQGAWTPWQMFAAGIIGFISGVLFQKGFLERNRTVICVYGFLITVIIYGGIMNFSSWVLSHSTANFETILAFYVQGLPYDIIHGFSTAMFLFFLAEPMLEKLGRVKTKYGLI